MAATVSGNVGRMWFPPTSQNTSVPPERAVFAYQARDLSTLAFPSLTASFTKDRRAFHVRAGASSEDALPSDNSSAGSAPSLPPSPVLSQGSTDSPSVPPPRNNSPRRTVPADSPDWVTSQITRRFGLGAGLAWVGFLAFGAISEQIKTRREAFDEEANARDVDKIEEIVTPSGIRYFDLRLGGGSSPQRGDLVMISLVGKVAGSEEAFVDTTITGRDEVFLFGGKRYSGGVCEGLELSLGNMKVGGKRKVIVPPSLGFGKDGAEFGGVVVPEGATLEYVVQLKRTSIAPA
eukprot:TRINITY_DN22817_c0_g2_i1.p1 TRINITY_DN22817_c0_g2~~TRINITY_DN22817_c0_g2_i1.p1  ORF type:complete len:291 (+),score=44.61 TRINITY_DN22817_c0_g2_i1:210-1082(+)